MGSLTVFPNGLLATPLVGGNGLDTFATVNAQQGVFFVDGDYGNDANDGSSPSNATKTIAQAIALAGIGSTVYVKPRNVAAGGTDPSNYAENLVIPATKPFMKLIGVGGGPAQGAQPQIKKGSGASAMITVRAPGCLIENLCINMVGSTGAGVLLDDDASTKTAFGTVIHNCVFKGNANKTNLAGAVAWSANGGAWQVLIKSCHFIDCTTGINALGTAVAALKDIVIEDCLFYAFANTDVDADIMFNVGSFGSAITVRNCEFGTIDVPQKAGGATARYIDLTGCTNSMLVGCRFNCVGKTFGAAGNAALIPTTCRIAQCYQEVAAGAGATGQIGRT